MKTIIAGFAALWILPVLVCGQSESVITMDQEPHHHLALHNEYVKVFDVHVLPGDSIILHRHDQDTVAIAIGEQLVTVGIPGKPDVHQKNADAQVRLQRSGYVHSTRVDGDTPYHTIAVELLHPQSNFHNACAEILPKQPLGCSGGAPKTTAYESQSLLESEQTQVWLVGLTGRGSADVEAISPSVGAPRLIVALDTASLALKGDKGSSQSLKPGDFVWIESVPVQSSTHLFENAGNGQARFIEFVFSPPK